MQDLKYTLSDYLKEKYKHLSDVKDTLIIIGTIIFMEIILPYGVLISLGILFFLWFYEFLSGVLDRRKIKESLDLWLSENQYLKSLSFIDQKTSKGVVIWRFSLDTGDTLLIKHPDWFTVNYSDIQIQIERYNYLRSVGRYTTTDY